MSRLRVTHTTAFRYAGPVTASYNEARMIPVSEPGQRVLASSLDVTPLSWRHDFVDYWGTAVSAFEITHPHERLVITARSTVELDPAASGAPGAGWDVVHGQRTRDLYGELLGATTTTTVPAAVVDLASGCLPGADPAAAAEAICRVVRAELEYVPGVTTVHTPASEAWESRTGVCQDMAHLTLGALRAVGIPARYVSGYLYPRTGGELGQTVVGESHAWIEWWAGRWTGFDPTNRVYAGDRHVVLARGREYNDVAPLRGIYAGTAAEQLDVKVQITREA
ncbi:transglutaminase family protein [Pengzhenrongella sicca]|uniref:Transglutaminase family protein n=1 Tax=Pengzhenrongella sicca TaxID=2819238 RepID=A0A8A4ZBW4_9MICO|nr:transglutaminase family protein [Pengzhenrongella sicca]QTE28489.1 transglutaminase family protein [Pengzhenrongella sicca]